MGQQVISARRSILIIGESSLSIPSPAIEKDRPDLRMPGEGGPTESAGKAPGMSLPPVV
jgi:hypothetical protein